MIHVSRLHAVKVTISKFSKKGCAVWIQAELDFIPFILYKIVFCARPLNVRLKYILISRAAKPTNIIADTTIETISKRFEKVHAFTQK